MKGANISLAMNSFRTEIKYSIVYAYLINTNLKQQLNYDLYFVIYSETNTCKLIICEIPSILYAEITLFISPLKEIKSFSMRGCVVFGGQKRLQSADLANHNNISFRMFQYNNESSISLLGYREYIIQNITPLTNIMQI